MAGVSSVRHSHVTQASCDKVLRREAIMLDAPAARCVTVLSKRDHEANPMSPRHINPVQWQQSIGYARQACARLFRDGSTPVDAMAAFGLTGAEPTSDWSIAVERIAHALCAPALRKAA
jgi:hypothetical protein